MLTRRLALACAALFFAGGVAQAAPQKRGGGDMSLGSPHAKVQVVEYASLSCPHCADFHAKVFPAFKAKYVDTGKVRYTMREMLTPPAEVAAAGFVIARCAGPSKYFDVVADVFRSQPLWTEGNIRSVLLDIAQRNGLSEAQFEACLDNQASYTALNQRVKAAIAAGVEGTPTFFVNGKKIAEGDVSLAQLDAAIAAAGQK